MHARNKQSKRHILLVPFLSTPSLLFVLISVILPLEMLARCFGVVGVVGLLCLCEYDLAASDSDRVAFRTGASDIVHVPS